MLRVLDLFSGIGGFSLGLERTGGFETIAFCEIEAFPRKVLAKHWPDVPCFEDVKKLKRSDIDGPVDVICGGFPCQDISLAGNGAGLDGERSGLWSEIARLAGELRPRYVIVENVAALVTRGLGTVIGDLAEIGYDAEWHCIPASYVGAWHRRDRIWILAYPCSINEKGGIKKPLLRQQDLSRKLSRGFKEWAGRPCISESLVHSGANGVSKRLAVLGNAVVPQIPEMIGYAILEAERENNG